VLVDIVLQPNISDQWLWRHDAGGGYSVKDAYRLLTTMDPPGVDAASDLIWHKQVPLKVSVLAWRLLRNKLPTKDNLVRRNIIAHDSHMCVSGCLWCLVKSWIGFSSADPNLLQNHFVQFTHSSGGMRVRRSFLQ
ncbi:70 kDa peptidyl-prolyl isomerase, partial [Trifolium medium]|nr:70 kDa peptidyl-prolyl isomerase [Trifolium medium]